MTIAIRDCLSPAHYAEYEFSANVRVLAGWRSSDGVLAAIAMHHLRLKVVAAGLHFRSPDSTITRVSFRSFSSEAADGIISNSDCSLIIDELAAFRDVWESDLNGAWLLFLLSDEDPRDILSGAYVGRRGSARDYLRDLENSARLRQMNEVK